MKVIVLISCMILVMHTSIQCTVEEFKGSPAEFETKLHRGKPAIIKFYEPWCPACKRFAPTFETMSQEYPTVSFINVNCDTNKEVARTQNIAAYPTVMYCNAKGKIIEKKVGAPRIEEFHKKIKSITTN